MTNQQIIAAAEAARTEYQLGATSEQVWDLIKALAENSSGILGGGVALVTYAELVALINASGLTVGSQYLITDYATKHYIVDYSGTKPAGNPTVTGTTEPIIVTAIAINKLDRVAKSTLYPQDIIHVDFDSTNWIDDISFSDSGVIITGFKGVIYFRHDTLLDNYAGFDFRNCKFRRWKTDVDAWDNGTTYALSDFVTHGNIIYKSRGNGNVGNTPDENSGFWLPYFSLDKTQYWLSSPSEWSNVPASTDFSDFKLFSEGAGTATYERSCRSNHFKSFKDNGTDYDISGTILNNIVFFLQDEDYYTVISNTFEPEAAFLTFSNGCSYSYFGEDARNMSLGAQSYCIYGAGCNDIISTGAANKVTLGASCIDIFIGAGVFSVTIGQTSTGLRIGKDSLILSFGNNSSNVAFIGAATMNKIEENFDGQGIDFTSATHVYAAYNCTLFTREGGGKRLIYYAADDTPTVVNANA